MRRYGLLVDPRTFQPGQVIGSRAGTAVAQPRTALELKTGLVDGGQAIHSSMEGDYPELSWFNQNSTYVYIGGGLLVLGTAWYFLRSKA